MGPVEDVEGVKEVVERVAGGHGGHHVVEFHRNVDAEHAEHHDLQHQPEDAPAAHVRVDVHRVEVIVPLDATARLPVKGDSHLRKEVKLRVVSHQVELQPVGLEVDPAPVLEEGKHGAGLGARQPLVEKVDKQVLAAGVDEAGVLGVPSLAAVLDEKLPREAVSRLRHIVRVREEGERGAEAQGGGRGYVDALPLVVVVPLLHHILAIVLAEHILEGGVQPVGSGVRLPGLAVGRRSPEVLPHRPVGHFAVYRLQPSLLQHNGADYPVVRRHIPRLGLGVGDHLDNLPARVVLVDLKPPSAGARLRCLRQVFPPHAGGEPPGNWAEVAGAGSVYRVPRVYRAETAQLADPLAAAEEAIGGAVVVRGARLAVADLHGGEHGDGG
mmetsp:Transcript_11650/g.30130  ORF Transcript_11650/g.30130 Transcript_11650/m.30130 type:complete len:383 (-) Transcript_11650:45-1193(-)